MKTGRPRYKTERAPSKPKSEKEKARKHRRVKPPSPEPQLTLKQSRFAKALTEQRTKKEAALLAGYSPLNPSQAAYQALKGIKKVTPEVMDEVGLSVKTLIQRHLVPMLNATEVKLAQHGGKFTDHEAAGERGDSARALRPRA